MSSDTIITVLVIVAAVLVIGGLSIMGIFRKAWSILTGLVCLLAAAGCIFLAWNTGGPSASKPEVIEATAAPEPTQQAAPSDEWTDDIPYQAELVLSQIAEDMAKQAAQNPGTVDMKDLTMGFANKGNLYAVQSEFECSNLMGVTEAHTIRVLCEANEDQSKIQPYEVYLDGALVASLDQ